MSYNKGKDNPMYGVRRTGKDAPFYGKSHSEDAKKRMGETRKGKKFTKAHRQKLSKVKKGIAPAACFIDCHNVTPGSFKPGKAHPFFGKKGCEASAWKGGISKLPYAFDFNKELKFLIRKRDKRTCQLCGKRKRANFDLLIHHIDYNKQNSNPKNLITLCRSCNSKVNGNRKSWTKFFKLELKLSKGIYSA